jgi:DNA-binding LacI/PurR family transcriptional regulator
VEGEVGVSGRGRQQQQCGDAQRRSQLRRRVERPGSGGLQRARQLGSQTPAEGAASAALLLDDDPRPTAILCLSDRLAEGAIQAARARGLEIPGDLSIVGFDDAAPAATLGLTTVNQPTLRKGELAATVLLNLIEQRPAKWTQRLPTRLIVRSSTGLPPDARRSG